MAKVIGIPGYVNEQRNGFGIGMTYIDFISKFGIPRILMPDEDLVNVDLLLLPGGSDLNPLSYGQTPSFRTSNQDVFKQHFFDTKLKLYIDSGTPIFGICLGHQMLAAYYGSTLEQDLKYHVQSKERWATAHKVTPTQEGKEFYPEHKKPEVNSHHHQAVLESTINLGELEVMMVGENEEDSEDNIIEALRHKELPIYSVQWHPEELYDSYSVRVINYLLTLKNP